MGIWVDLLRNNEFIILCMCIIDFGKVRDFIGYCKEIEIYN